MKLEQLLDNISIKGSKINNIESNLVQGMLRINVINRLSEFNLEYRGSEILPSDIVEVQIVLSGIQYVCVDFSEEKGKDVLEVALGIMDSYDIVMIRTFGNDEYNELYIRGFEIQADWKIIKKYIRKK